MTPLDQRQEIPDWDDAGWEEDRLEYEAASLRLKLSEQEKSSSVPLPTAAGNTTIVEVEDATPIPFPLRDKPEYFPAFIARSAMFKAGRAKAKETTDGLHIEAQSGYHLSITGPRLTMRDKQVWEVAIQIAKETSSDMCQAYEISLTDFARRMGLSDRSAKTLTPIWSSLRKLCVVRIAFKLPSGHEGDGSLLATAAKVDDRFYLRVNPDFTWRALALDDQFRIQSARRCTLSTSVAQWLHDFLSTHTTNIDFTVDYLRKLCGYTGPLRNFPKVLREALDELVSKVPVLVEAYAIDDSLRSSDRWIVRLTRGPEKPQFVMHKTCQATAVAKPAKKPFGNARKGRGGVAL